VHHCPISDSGENIRYIAVYGDRCILVEGVTVMKKVGAKHYAKSFWAKILAVPEAKRRWVIRAKRFEIPNKLTNIVQYALECEILYPLGHGGRGHCGVPEGE
jgi:hypothetical protein